jgi:TonB family protein
MKFIPTDHDIKLFKIACIETFKKSEAAKTSLAPEAWAAFLWDTTVEETKKLAVEDEIHRRLGIEPPSRPAPPAPCPDPDCTCQNCCIHKLACIFAERTVREFPSPPPPLEGSTLELKTDPMGVDFQPYLTQTLENIRRNWFAVMPENVKLGHRGKVGLIFSITKGGDISKISWAFQSGSDSLDRAAVAAMSASNPFPPLPVEFKGDRITLQINFVYNKQTPEDQHTAEQNGQQASGPEKKATPTVLRGLAKVAGMHALKELLRREVVEPVRNPEPYRRYGLSIPNGILLYGPPGCGKTYIAQHLAEELGHYFIEVIPSEFASLWMHGSVTRIRELFDRAVEKAPTILFIDEFEALVPARRELGGWQQWKAEEVNELLTHLNRSSEKKIFVIAATNEPSKIDPAMLRTGRLDKHIYVGPPDQEARREMLALHLKGRPVAPDLDLAVLAAALDYYSASDIRFMVDEAAREAMLRDEDIHHGSFQSAMARIPRSFGPETESQYRLIEQRGF